MHVEAFDIAGANITREIYSLNVSTLAVKLQRIIRWIVKVSRSEWMKGNEIVNVKLNAVSETSNYIIINILDVLKCNCIYSTYLIE